MKTREARMEDSDWMAQVYDLEVSRGVFTGFGQPSGGVFRKMVEHSHVEIPLPTGSYRTPVSVRILQQDGGAVGLGILKAWIDEAVLNDLEPSKVNTVQDIELWVLLIDLKHRRRGLGSLLCSDLITEARRLVGSGRIMARCGPQSQGGRKTLLAQGFRVVRQLTSVEILQFTPRLPLQPVH